MNRYSPPALLWLVFTALACSTPLTQAGELEIRAIDSETGELISARMHVEDRRGRTRTIRGLPNWGGHFVFDGMTVLTLPTGEYNFRIECGPQYRDRTGYFILERGAADNKTVEMVRFANLAEEGWYSGDLSIQRREEDIPVLLRAEDLNVAPLTTWTTEDNPWAEGLPDETTGTAADDRIYSLLGGGRCARRRRAAIL